MGGFQTSLMSLTANPEYVMLRLTSAGVVIE